MPIISIENQVIEMQKTLKYFGVVMDRRLSFAAHVEATTTKASNVEGAFARLMTRVNGPSQAKRRLISSAVTSVLLYAVPIWEQALTKGYNRKKMETVHRRCALRTTSAYHTVSHTAGQAIAGIPPITLMAKRRVEKRKYKNDAGIDKEEIMKRLDDEMYGKWQEMMNHAEVGKWTTTLIGDIRRWATRKHGSMKYHLTQAFSGHRSFGSYLYKIGKRTDDKCNECGEKNDNARHAIYYCQR